MPASPPSPRSLSFVEAQSSKQAQSALVAQRGVTSDEMVMEQERCISITSSILTFEYEGKRINITDCPRHADFSEDTYRTLTAVDNAVMLIDGRKGLEGQTRKLFAVCRMRKLPTFSFVNKGHAQPEHV